MDKPIIFVSHINEDASIAQALQEWLTKKLAGSVEIFVSSDKKKSLPGGKDWWDVIRQKLRTSEFVLILVTKRAINRRWVYFESGGGYFLEKTTIPLLIGEVKVEDLLPPLSLLQVYKMSDSQEVALLFKQLVDKFKLESDDDGKQISAYLRELDSKISNDEQFETHSTVSSQPQKITDEDALNILESWFSSLAPAQQTKVIYFEEVDKINHLPLGTSKKLLEKAVLRLGGFSLKSEGDITTKFKKEHPPPTPLIRKVSKFNPGAY